MQTKTPQQRQHLIDSLKIVHNALKNDAINYNWTKQCSCNCGIVAQAILGKNQTELNEMIDKVFDREYFRKVLKKDSGEKIELTWRNAVQVYCPLTGEPLHDIFKKLEEAGLNRFDMTHLEYLSNPEILRRAGIKKTYTEKKQVKSGTKMKLGTSMMDKLFNKHYPEDIYTTVDVEVPEKDPHQNIENLTKYIGAWVEMLEEEMRSVI